MADPAYDELEERRNHVCTAQFKAFLKDIDRVRCLIDNYMSLEEKIGLHDLMGTYHI